MELLLVSAQNNTLKAFLQYTSINATLYSVIRESTTGQKLVNSFHLLLYSLIQKIVSSHTARAFQGLFDGRKTMNHITLTNETGTE